MSAVDFLDDENWHGSYYELAIMLGSPYDPDADDRAQAARAALWEDPRLQGCYLDRWRTPEDQERIEPHALAVELSVPLYGRARLPNAIRPAWNAATLRHRPSGAATARVVPR